MRWVYFQKQKNFEAIYIKKAYCYAREFHVILNKEVSL